jgi:hypothetical protein
MLRVVERSSHERLHVDVADIQQEFRTIAIRPATAREDVGNGACCAESPVAPRA